MLFFSNLYNIDAWQEQPSGMEEDPCDVFEAQTVKPVQTAQRNQVAKKIKVRFHQQFCAAKLYENGGLACACL